MLDSAELKTEVGWGETKVDCAMDVDYSKNNIEPFEEHSVFYFDKSVTDCELPEIIVCYKESTYHVVKDICVDERVPSKDKFFFESSEDDKIVRTFPITIENDAAELKGGNQNDIMNLSEENHCSEKTDNQCDTMDLMTTEETGKHEKENIADGVSKISLGEMFAMDKLHPENCNSTFPDVNSCAAADEQPSVQESSDSIDEMNNDSRLPEETILCSTSTSEELNDGSKPTEESLDVPAQTSATKESESKIDTTIPAKLVSESGESSPDNDLCYDGKVETGNDLCYDGKAETDNDFDPRAPPASGSTEGCHQSCTDELPADESSTEGCHNDKMKTESITLDSYSCVPPASGSTEECHQISTEESSECHQISTGKSINELFENEGQDNHRESSFSMAELPVSGSICYSGSIAYSGNISHRSDSSTTSTRSFAFPVLPNEWNSSPVRMAKADRRRYSKHRGCWRNVVPCCRF